MSNGSKRIPPYVVLQKKRGETPLETIASWKQANPSFADVPASYAGRLDPMAEGLLLVLLGEECKKQSDYTKLDKTYDIEVLLDVGTDTGDVLGIPNYKVMARSSTEEIVLQVPNVLRAERGSRSRKYPVYSSKTVNGKPLFLYALEGTLSSITIPEHIETIYRISLEKIETVTTEALHTRIQNLLSVVPRSDEPSKALGADFRQDRVRAEWETLFARLPVRAFTILRLRVTCGSGVYMRTLAERLGEALGSTGVALSIRRTKIGKFRSFGPWGFWTKSYAESVVR
jgi:tRNA pseudouridine(55) synthase